MKVQLLRYAAGAVAAGALAAVGVYVLPTGTAAWQPVTYGLTRTAEELVPATVSVAAPARVVSTKVGRDGKPVVSVKEATDRAATAKLIKDGQQADGAVSVEIDTPVYALGVPTGSDPYRSQQWDLAKMRVAEGWQKSTGSGVTVAVIDTGVDSSHPDLAANVLRGYDAVANRAGVITDGNGHGTHVAGTIAAVTGNNAGVSAVAPDARILPVKVLSDNGSGYSSDTAEGIVWAADNGAKVINMSLGGPSRSTAVSNAIAYARSKGVTVVAAAGNERQSGSPTSYPGADQGVIAVAATTSADGIASYSNAGSYVDVAAPGSGILSTYPMRLGNGYASLNGTSMASPHVAAVAALLKAYQPLLTPDQIEAALEKSAVDLGTRGFDSDYGNGRVDAAAALTVVTPPTTPPTTAPTTPSTAPTTPSTAPPTPTTAPTTSPAPSGSTPAAPKLTPLITTNVTTREVAYGTRVSVTFTVRVGGKSLNRKPVRLCVAETGSEAVCTETTTGATGSVVLTRTATAGFKVHAEVAETATTNAARSATSTFTVRAKVTLARTAKGVMTVALLGAAGQTVQVQQYANRAWQNVGEYTAAPMTRVSGLIPGQRYRVVVPDTAAILGTASIPITA
ncbi:S8 family peptidase [Actinoplanes sp. NPDC023801]|uniref:S8 family peptidase n=1 Tax=Actinoplanes sp. NPDC023801 TaxID=3154595 RepID=UPI0033C938CC